MTIQAIASGLYTKLAGSTTAGTVYALCSGRIYNGEGPQHTDPAATDMPMCIFTIISHDPDAQLFRARHIDAEVQIDVYTDKALGRAAARSVSDALITGFDHTSVTISGYAGGQMDCINPGIVEPDGDALRVMTTWRVTAT